MMHRHVLFGFGEQRGAPEEASGLCCRYALIRSVTSLSPGLAPSVAYSRAGVLNIVVQLTCEKLNWAVGDN
jgi:hypothetical protein